MFKAIKKFIRNCNIHAIMVELSLNHAEIKGTIPVTSELFLIKDDRWYVFCIKPDWKKAIGISYHYVEDVWVTYWYTGKNICNIGKEKTWKTRKFSYDIPVEMREELLNQISDNYNKIENILDELEVEEYYSKKIVGEN